MKRIFRHLPIKIALLLFFLFLITYIIFNEQIAAWAYPGSENRNGELLKDFLSISGGLAVLAGLYLSFVRSRAIEETVRNQQDQIKNQQVEIGLTRDSNLNEQFKNAVEHLGNEREPIILGGVAELDQLATNQPDKFAQVVVNIYASYCKSESDSKKSDDEIKWSVVNVILNNLCHNQVYSHFQVDLSYTNLFSVSLNHAKIEGWSFSYSKLPKKAHNIHFIGCNFDFSSGFLTDYVDVIFEDCKLHKVYLEQGKWIYPKLTGNTKLSVLALNSEFHAMQVKGELLSSYFLNCSIRHTTFEKEFLASTEFLCCKLEKVSFRQSKATLNKFDGSGMDKVIFRGSINSTSFRGVSRNVSRESHFSLYSKLTYSLNKETDLSGISFQGITKNIDGDPLTEYDAYHISRRFNKIVEKHAYAKNFQIKIPEEWKEAALENGSYEEEENKY